MIDTSALTPSLNTGGESLGSAPPPIIAQRAPTTSDLGYLLTQLWLDETTDTLYGNAGESNNSASWPALGGSTTAIGTINNNAPVAGNYTLAGTANQITKTDTAGTTTFSIPAAFTAPGSITSTTTIASGTTLTAGTTITATLGDITTTNGNFVSTTAGKGLSFNANTATGAAASPVVLNSRAGQVVFSSVSIAAAADLTLTITNSAITGSSTQVIHSISGATTGSAISVKSKTASAGSIAFVITNATGATTTTADITITFIVVN